jgi:hypothetical protein
MTSTSTLLCGCQFDSNGMAYGEAVNVHFLVVGSHLALENLLETGNSFQCLTGVVQHSLGDRAGVMAIEQSAGGAVAKGAA